MSDASAKPEPILGKSESRALAIILFNKIHKELTSSEDELTERRAARIIQDALNLLPGYRSEPGSKTSILKIVREESGREEQTCEMNIQDAIDSLMVVWKEYLSLADPEQHPLKVRTRKPSSELTTQASKIQGATGE